MSNIRDEYSRAGAPDPLIEQLYTIFGKLQDMYTIEPELTSKQAVAEVFQAFTEAGWNDQHKYSWSGDGTNTFTEVMTGQEFLDRFKAELQRQGPPTLEPRMAYPEEVEANVLAAARRAAGVSDE